MTNARVDRARTTKPATITTQRIADLDRMLDEGDDGSSHFSNVVLRELIDLQFAILTRQVPLTIDDLRVRVRRADEIIPGNVTTSLPR